MVGDQPSLSDQSAQLQEAIDMIVRTFEYPETISIKYTLEDSEKRTIFEITTTDGSITYELSHRGDNDEAEPELVRVD